MARLRDSHFKSKLGLLECSFLALAKGVAGVCIYLSFSCFVEYPIEWVNHQCELRGEIKIFDSSADFTYKKN